jgi:hypothetical protein
MTFNSIKYSGQQGKNILTPYTSLVGRVVKLAPTGEGQDAIGHPLGAGEAFRHKPDEFRDLWKYLHALVTVEMAWLLGRAAMTRPCR